MAAGVVTAAFGGVVATGPAAHADVVTVNYSCETILGTQVGDVELTVEAPATAVVGDTVEVKVTPGPTPFTSPLDLPEGSVTATATAVISGAQTGTFELTGPANPEPIPANTPVTLQPLTGSFTVTSPGQVDLTPGNVTVTADVPLIGVLTVPCTLTSPAPVAASIQVQEPEPASVTVNYSCETILGTQVGDVELTVEAPATAAVGDTVPVTVTPGPTPFTSPLDLPAGSVTAVATAHLANAQTGTFEVAGQPNAEPIPANTPVNLGPLTGSFVATTAGQVDLVPGNVTVTANVPDVGVLTVPCTLTAPAPVAASVQVS
jgi:hypothetical protein